MWNRCAHGSRRASCMTSRQMGHTSLNCCSSAAVAAGYRSDSRALSLLGCDRARIIQSAHRWNVRYLDAQASSAVTLFLRGVTAVLATCPFQA